MTNNLADDAIEYEEEGRTKEDEDFDIPESIVTNPPFELASAVQDFVRFLSEEKSATLAYTSIVLNVLNKGILKLAEAIPSIVAQRMSEKDESDDWDREMYVWLCNNTLNVLPIQLDRLHLSETADGSIITRKQLADVFSSLYGYRSMFAAPFKFIWE
jgi:hypothetical protein